MIDAGVPGDPNGLTEKLLVEAQASSMFSLNAWSGLEQCSAQEIPGDVAYRVDPDPSTPGVFEDFNNCLIDDQVVGTCYCYHYFRDSNPKDDFNPWLDKFVQHKQCGNSDDGRSALIQLGPIFSWGRAVPAYLYDVPFDHADMITAFARFWDDFSQRLLQSKLTLPTNEFPRTPEWIISIGNEINLYLDSPKAIQDALYVDGIGSMASDSENVTKAWERYFTFYQRAKDYIRGLPVTVNGNTLQNTSTPFAWITFSTTWSSSPDPTHPHCSPGWALANSGVPCPQTPEVIASFMDMLAISTFASYTYYPYPFGADAPGTPGLDAAFFRFVVSLDLAGMENVSYIAANTVGRALPIVLQEVGYPSSWVDPNPPIPPGSFKSDNIADQQEAFVQGSIEALRAHNGKWIREFDWWADALFTPPPDPLQGPFVVPRIVSYNAFMLHDFFDFTVIGVCPFERFDPDPELNGMAPTRLGVFLCSLGLRTEAAAEKDAGAGKTPWGTFVDAAAPITDPGLDPDRSCP